VQGPAAGEILDDPLVVQPEAQDVLATLGQRDPHAVAATLLGPPQQRGLGPDGAEIASHDVADDVEKRNRKNTEERNSGSGFRGISTLEAISKLAFHLGRQRK